MGNINKTHSVFSRRGLQPALVNAPKDWKPFDVRLSDIPKKSPTSINKNITRGQRVSDLPLKPSVCTSTGVTVDVDTRSSKLKGIIDPEHLLQAIENSLEHCDETPHGVTGLTFKRYTITVRRRAGLSWSVECRFRKADTDLSLQPTKHSRSQCRTQLKSR